MSFTFDDRLKQGKGYEEECKNEWISLGFQHTPIGIEKGDPNFHKVLKQMSDLTSINLRYTPDAAITNGKFTAYYDAKKARFIEKQSYNAYMAISESGQIFILCIKDPSTLAEYWVPIEFLKLKEGSVFEDYPVDTDGWICPEAWNNPNVPYYNPEKYIEKKKRASCKPHKEIDFDKIQRYKITSERRRKDVVDSIIANMVPPPESYTRQSRTSEVQAKSNPTPIGSSTTPRLSGEI